MTSYKTKITLSQLEKLTAAGYSAKINTPTGFEQITDTYRKHSEGVKLHLSNGATIRCARDHLISVNGSWTKAKQLVVGEAIGNVRVVSIEPLPPQDWIDFSIDAEHESYYHGGLLHHNSGKSLILYCLVRWHEQFNRRQLIIVPTTSLCLQMKSDFKSYSLNNGWDGDQVRVIMGGEEKDNTSAVTVSTWQSLYDLPKKFFADFDVVYGDECLHPDSLITMSDGTTKKICDVEVGDFVKTFNESTKCFESNLVLKKHLNISVSEQMYELSLGNGSAVKITGNHKVLLTNGNWKRVDDLQIGDTINSIE